MSTFRFSFPDTKRYNEAARKLTRFRIDAKLFRLDVNIKTYHFTTRHLISGGKISIWDEDLFMFLHLEVIYNRFKESLEKPWITQYGGSHIPGKTQFDTDPHKPITS